MKAVTQPRAFETREKILQAAARLFECLHRLDGLRLESIDAERVPAVGLGVAINDRLGRAAAGHATMA